MLKIIVERQSKSYDIVVSRRQITIERGSKSISVRRSPKNITISRPNRSIDIVNRSNNITINRPKVTYSIHSRGLRGDKGDAATITVGTTTTGPAGTQAQVTNSGNQNNAVLNFTIPKGDQGDPATNLVTSVNGKQGAVVLNSTDVSADPSGSAAQALSDAKDYTDIAVSNIDTGVLSVQAGSNVTIDNTDPKNPIVSSLGGGTAADITYDNSSGLDATNVQDAIDEITSILGLPAGWDVLDVSDHFYDFLAGQPIDLGTNGVAILVYREEKDMIKGYLFMFIDEDNNSASVSADGFSIFGIPTSVFPEEAALPGGSAWGVPMSFGYMSLFPDDNNNGGLYSTAPVISDLTGGTDPNAVGALVFIKDLPATTVYGFEGLLGQGNPINLSGRLGTLQAAIEYPIKGKFPSI